MHVNPYRHGDGQVLWTLSVFRVLEEHHKLVVFLVTCNTSIDFLWAKTVHEISKKYENCKHITLKIIECHYIIIDISTAVN